MSNPKMADAFGASAEDFKFFEKLVARSAGGKSGPLSPDNAKRGVQLGAFSWRFQGAERPAIITCV